MADQDLNIIDISYNSISTSTKNIKTDSESQGYQSSYRFLLEYGVSKTNSIGVYTTKTLINNIEDFGDFSLYVKGYNNGFLYQLTGHISPERSGDENADTGGDHLSLKLGYEFNKYFGFDFTYGPEYSYKITDLEDKTEYKRGSSQEISLHVESPFFEDAIGLALSYLNTESPTEDGKRTSVDSNYSQVYFYYNLVFGSYEVMPSIRYLNYLGDNADVEINSTAMSLNIRKNFEYPNFWEK
jgi:hypothetical protein